MHDLAPDIYCQRLVVEGLCREPIDAASIRDYLFKLSEIIEMITLAEPVTHQLADVRLGGLDPLGDLRRPLLRLGDPTLFFSVDIYACKAFRPEDVVGFTREFFGADELVWKDC